MKKILCIVIALISVAQVSAKGIEPKSPVGISVIKQGALIKLFYKGGQTGKVKVTIYNPAGGIVFRETMFNTENFMRPYNFAGLPEGDYMIELSDSQGKRSQKIVHRRPDRHRTAYLTRLGKLEQKYMLSVPNEGQDALTVRIYDAHSRMLYSETEIVEGNFAKVYNLNDIRGEHLFEITDKSGRTSRLMKPLR